MPDPTPPPPRVQVIEEPAETLDVLDLDRTPRPEKMTREAAFLDKGDEVAYRELAFKPRRAGGIDEVRAAVDALERRATAFPEPRPLEPLPTPEPPRATIDPRLLAALEPVVRGKILRAEPVQRDGADGVVEVEVEGSRPELYVVTGGVARPLDGIAARIDELPTPETPRAPEPVPEPLVVPAREPERAAPPAEAPAKKGLRMPFGKKKEPAAPAPPPEPSADDAKPKRRFGFGRK